MNMRRVILGAAAVLVPALGYAAWSFAGSAAVGPAAMAKVACSCVFVERRELAACRADDPPGFEGISVEIDRSRQVATGSVMGVISRTAVFTSQYGCTLEP